jgi:hypothetical protein
VKNRLQTLLFQMHNLYRYSAVGVLANLSAHPPSRTALLLRHAAAAEEVGTGGL